MTERLNHVGRRKLLAAGGAAGLAFLAGSAGKALAARKRYRLLTAAPGDAYYPVGVALATLVKIKLLDAFGIDMVAETSPGSPANPGLLQAGEGEFAFVQKYTLSTAPESGRSGLRTVATLWSNVEHVLIDSRFVNTGNLDDLVALRGKPVYFGPENSAAYITNTTILDSFSLHPARDFVSVAGSYVEAVELLLKGEIAAASLPGAVPVTAVGKAFAESAGRIRFLTITHEQHRHIDNGRGLWSAARLESGTYKGQSIAVDSLRQPNILVVREDVPEKTVYRILNAVFSDVAFLHQIHSATREITLDSAAAPSPLPFHPGAEEFFLDYGIDVTET